MWEMVMDQLMPLSPGPCKMVGVTLGLNSYGVRSSEIFRDAQPYLLWSLQDKDRAARVDASSPLLDNHYPPEGAALEVLKK